MNAQAVLNSGITVGLALMLARMVAPGIGRPASRALADCVASRKGWAWVRAVRANQWVISGRCLSARELDRAALAVLRHQARCLFDLYHWRRDPLALQELSPLTDEAAALIERSQSRRGGALVVIPHLSSFDVAFIANGHRGLQAQWLTLAQPKGGYLVQNRLRVVDGFEITPVCEESTCQAIARLRAGGMVITGIDRPIAGKKRTLSFFGQPSVLPAGHIRMALEAGVPVIAAGVNMSAQGKYRLMVSEPIPMRLYEDQNTTIRRNAEAVLEVIAGYICRAPHQWLMYYPLWPHLSADIPQ